MNGHRTTPLRVQCTERGALPATATVRAGDGDVVQVLLLDDLGLGEGARLRATVLRPTGGEPVPGATPLFDLVVLSLEGMAPAMEIADVTEDYPVDLTREEQTRPLGSGETLLSGDVVHVSVGGALTLDLAFDVHDPWSPTAHEGGMAVQRPAAELRRAWSTARARIVISGLARDGWAHLRRALETLGPVRRTLLVAATVVVLVSGAIGLFTAQGHRAREARELAERREQEARECAGQSESTAASLAECMAERREIVAVLGDLESVRSLDAQIALQLPLSRARALDLHSARFGGEALQLFDARWDASVTGLVAEEAWSGARLGEGLSRCLAQVPLLGSDLPAYVALWHGGEGEPCTDPGGAGDSGAAGRWGLSSRVAYQYAYVRSAARAHDDLLGPREDDEWSIRALAAGMRGVVDAVAYADTGARPPCAPGQLHLWSLALWDAYNALPPVGPYTDAADAAECAGAFVAARAAAVPSGRPGEPVLPDLAAVAQGEEELEVTLDARCPWTEEMLREAARAAVQAAARQAQLAGGGR